MEINGKIYLAGPWFNHAQVERYEAVLAVLHAWQYGAPNRKLYVPRDLPCLPDADDETRRRIYDRNLVELERADAVVAITDEKDVGTIFELGYAAKIRDARRTNGSLREGPKLIGVALDLGDRPFNLMLAVGLDATARTVEELERVLLLGELVAYAGRIE
jgi:hypothetical protein